ncbi:MAG: TolC family protein [Chlorobiaceae bacterium]|nr:TolC family protein [Chlorobiaceae bacterium]
MHSPLLRTAAIAATLMLLATPCRATSAENTTEAPLTIEQTIRLVIENNHILKAGADDVKAANARITQGRSAYLPQITATAGYTYLNPVPEMSFFGSPMLKFAPNDNYEAKITAKATLFDFGKRGSTVDLARTGKKTAEQSLELSRRDLSFQAVQLFYGILFLRENITVEQKEITALNKALDFTTKRYQTGAATRFDVLSTEVRIAAAKSKMLDLNHELLRRELSLRHLTGIADNLPLTMQGSFSVTPAERKESELLTQALEQRLEMKLSIEQEHAARQRRSIAMHDGLPVLSASASYGVTNGLLPDINEIRENFVGSLHLEVPLFSGFKTSAERQEATALMHAAAQRKFDTELQVRSDVEETIHALKTSSEKITTTEVQVQQAKLAAEHARTRYENGMATVLDLLNTEASLSEAELARLQANYAYVMNNYTLKRATGEIFW